MSNLPMTLHPIYTGAAGVLPYNEVIARRLTYVTKYGDEVKLYRVWGTQSNRMMSVPRGLCASLGEDRRVSGGWTTKISSVFVPRNDEQARVVEEVTSALLAGRSHILSSPTGSGKTAMALEAIRQIGETTLIIVTKEDVKNQWLASIEKFWGVPSSGVGLIQGDRFDVAGKPISLAMIQSICKEGRYPDWVYRIFGLVVVDEVHRLGADLFNEAIWLLPAKLRLGLSATPTRTDGKTIVFQAHIGPVGVLSDQIPEVPRVIVAAIETPGLYRVPHKPARTQTANKYLAGSAVRNKAMASFVEQAYRAGRNIVLFSDLLEHLSTMEMFLLKEGVAKTDITYYIGGLTAREQEIAKRGKIVLATYKMASEATDAPWWDTAVLATPRANVVQIVGRVLRTYPEKKIPLVFDVVDVSSSVFVGFWRKRNDWYRKIGADVVKVGGEENV
jgi:superfamily II DNA or RNA helicase